MRQEEEEPTPPTTTEQVACDVGGNGDCGFLSIIASLLNCYLPAGYWIEEVQAMRDLIGSYWKLVDPPKSQDDAILGSLEPDPMFPQEDITRAGVFMQDKDIIILLHLMDLEEIRVGEQRFVQDKTWGEALRKALDGPLREFWKKAWALKLTKRAHIQHSRLHFKAMVTKTSEPVTLDLR